jgi:hypothetical protein
MMLGVHDCLSNAPYVGRGWSRDSLRMGVPIAYEVEPATVHVVDLFLLFSSIRNVPVTRTSISGSRPSGSLHANVLALKSGKELTSSL